MANVHQNNLTIAATLKLMCESFAYDPWLEDKRFMCNVLERALVRKHITQEEHDAAQNSIAVFIQWLHPNCDHNSSMKGVFSLILLPVDEAKLICLYCNWKNRHKIVARWRKAAGTPSIIHTVSGILPINKPKSGI